MDKLKGKTALVTGGSSGIGLAAARLFRAEGARVAITGRDEGRLREARRELGDDTLVIKSEAGSLAEIDALLAAVKDGFGHPDMLFLNAGIGIPAPVDFMTEARFDEIMNVNSGSANFSVYGASKAALRSMAQSLALIGRGIRINAVNPGPIETGGFNRLEMPTEVMQAVRSDIEGRSLSKRFGTPEEVAKVALFLACEDSAYVVGEEIVVDGGISLVCLP